MITIIKAEEKYIPAVLEIENEAFSPAWQEGALLNELGREDALFVLAVRDEAVLGFCLLKKLADEAELYQIAVAAHSRGRGIADILLAAAVTYAKKNGVVAIYLEVRKSNAPAIGLYKKHGFKVDGRRKNYYSSPVEDAVVMSLKIT